MSSRQTMSRTLVPIKRHPREPLSFRRDIEKVTRPPSIKNEIGDKDSSQSSPTLSMVLVSVKQETSQELVHNVKIKSEFGNETSVTNQINLGDIKTEVPVKMEQEEKNHSSLSQWKVPMPKCKIEPIKTFYKCCNIKFDDKFQHFRHMIDHMEEELTSVKIKCYYCFRYFKTEKDMIRHAKSKHTGFQCMSCYQNFVNRRLLIQHLTVVHNYKPRKNENLNDNKVFRWHRQIWDDKAKIMDGKIIKDEELKIKIEQQPPVQKIEPMLSTVKTETKFSNIKLESTMSNIKK